MSELPDPISEVLKDTAHESRVQGNWQAIRDRMATRPQRAGARNVGFALAAAAVLALAVYAVRSNTNEGAGPLTLASGAPIPSQLQTRTALADGSEVTPRGTVRLARNDAHNVEWILIEGRARFSVTPHGPRTWRVEIGLATVEVVGTVFEVARGDGWAEVSVERGRVLVRGERVPDRVVALGPGESVRVEREALGVPSLGEPAAAPESTPEGASSSEAVRAAPPRVTSAEVTPPALPGSGASEQPASAPNERSTAHALSADALMAQADEARAHGALARAADLLRQAARLTADPSSGVAAFTLGRLELEGLHRPMRAAEAYGWALERRLTPTLREDATRGRAQALLAAGREELAREVVDHYLRSYPDGRYLAEMRALAEPR